MKTQKGLKCTVENEALEWMIKSNPIRTYNSGTTGDHFRAVRHLGN